MILAASEQYHAVSVCCVITQAVRLLLDHVDRRQVYQALLAAINLGNEDIAETIIEHPKYDEISSELSKQRGALQQFNDDSQFSEVFSSELSKQRGALQQFNDDSQFSEVFSSELSKQRGALQQFNDDSQFSEEITPLILASQQNRFEVRRLMTTGVHV